MPGADPVIAVDGLGKSFDGRAVIAGVSMRLERGALLGLVGANGGGKTTTLRMLTGLLRPDVGSGTVLGCDVRKGHPARRRIGYMVQRSTLDPELTVRQTLQFFARMQGVSNPAAVIAALVDRFGLEPMVKQRNAILSGGWARRVQLAATMVHAPELLLLDEPTAGIDAMNRHLIWQWLEELAQWGTTVVISTHDLAEAERCPQILLYDGGQAEGPMVPQQLLAQTGAPSLEAAVLARAGA